MTLIRKIQIENLGILSSDISPTANILTTQLQEGASFIKRNGSVAFTNNQSLGNNRITDLGAPINPNDAARLLDIQNASLGISGKEACRVATTSNITLSGIQTIDSVVLVAGDRVLVKNQTDEKQNGIWVVASGSWTRATDANSSDNLKAGTFVFVNEGVLNLDTGWLLSSNGVITIGTSDITWIQFSGAGVVTAGNGLTRSGSVISALSASTARIIVSSSGIDLAEVAVTPGTYSGLTIDNYGRITAATDPGYSIDTNVLHTTGNESKDGDLSLLKKLIFPKSGFYQWELQVASDNRLSVRNLFNTADDYFSITENGHVGVNAVNPDVFARAYTRMFTVNSIGQSAIGINGGAQADFDMGLGGVRTLNLNTTSTENTITAYSKPLYINVNGDIRMSFANTGRIGIGTTTPSYKLDVIGNARFTSIIRSETAIDVTGTSYIGFASDTWTLNYDIVGGLNFTKQGLLSGALFLKDNGYVGIGTVNPQYKLHVNGNANIQTNLEFASGEWAARYNHTTSAFNIWRSTGYEFVVRNSGNVGINTPYPEHKFVVSNHGNEGLEIAVGGFDDKRIYIQNYDRVASTYRPMYYAAYYHIFDSGNVGIGAAPSSARLQVAGISGQATAYFYNYATDPGTSFGLTVEAGSNNSDYSADFRDKAGTSILRITGGSYVGINNVAPSYHLDVRGVTKLYRPFVNGAGWATSVIIGTDAKTNGDGIIIALMGKDAIDADWVYGRIASHIDDSAALSGSLRLQTSNAGTYVDALTLSKEGNATIAGNVTMAPATLSTQAATLGQVWVEAAAVFGNPTIVTDFNTPTRFKLLQGDPWATNSPSGAEAWYQGIQFSVNNNPDYANQFVISISGVPYIRNKIGGSWGAWSSIAYDKNVIHNFGNEAKNGNLTFDNAADSYSGKIHLLITPLNTSIIISSKTNSSFPILQLNDLERTGGNAWNIESGRTLTALSFYSNSHGEVIKFLADGHITGKGATLGSTYFDNYIYDGSYQIRNRTAPGGWARGMYITDASDNTYISFGALGNAEAFTYGYIGTGASPYLDSQIKITGAGVGINLAGTNVPDRAFVVNGNSLLSGDVEVKGTHRIHGTGYSLQEFVSSGTILGYIGQGNYVTTGGSSYSLGIRGLVDLELGAGTLRQIIIEGSTGNVKIGLTTTASAKLHIADGQGGNQLAITRGSGRILFGQVLNTHNLIMYGGASGSESLYQIWHASGNTSIGTSIEVSDAKLNVNGNINLAHGGNLTFGGSYSAGYSTIAAVNDYFAFYPGGGSMKVKFHANGRVGIGTESPSQLLDVNGAVIIGSGTVNALNTALYIRNEAGITWAVSSGAYGVTETNFTIRNVATGIMPFSIYNTGQVCIGTFSNPSLLNVGGDATFYGEVYVPWGTTLSSAINVSQLRAFDNGGAIISNFNDPTGFRILRGAVTTTNTPTGSWTQGIQFSTNNDLNYANQLVYDINGTLSTRTKYAGTWGAWYKVWTSLDFAQSNIDYWNKALYYVTGGGISNGSETYRNNAVWFDYNFGGSGYVGSVISFSGLSTTGNYAVQIMGDYSTGTNLLFRTRNGDAGTWHDVRRIWTDAQFTSYHIATWGTAYARTQHMSADSDGTFISGPKVFIDNVLEYNVPASTEAMTGEMTTLGGGTVSAGKIHYFDSSGSWVASDNASETAASGWITIALGGAPNEGMLLKGYMSSSSYSFTTGAKIYIGAGGALTQTPPTTSGLFKRVVGYAVSTNTIYFCPDNTWIEIL